MKVQTKNIVHDQLFDESKHPHLTPDRIYLVVEIDDTCFRIINDKLEPILYRKELFHIVDPDIPQDWIRCDFDDGGYSINPPNLGDQGFYEDYFDGIAYVVKAFEAYRTLKLLH